MATRNGAFSAIASYHRPTIGRTRVAVLCPTPAKTPTPAHPAAHTSWTAPPRIPCARTPGPPLWWAAACGPLEGRAGLGPGPKAHFLARVGATPPPRARPQPGPPWFPVDRAVRRTQPAADCRRPRWPVGLMRPHFRRVPRRERTAGRSRPGDTRPGAAACGSPIHRPPRSCSTLLARAQASRQEAPLRLCLDKPLRQRRAGLHRGQCSKGRRWLGRRARPARTPGQQQRQQQSTDAQERASPRGNPPPGVAHFSASL
jgi:hypothetical protein